MDPKVSPHYLTTMKKAYLKLRFLVDSGCIFVGHDLRHDFKSINIIVPPQQVTFMTGCHSLPCTHGSVNFSWLSAHVTCSCT